MNVYYLSLKKDTPKNHYWDYAFLNDFVSGRMWRPRGFPKFKTHEVDNLPKDKIALVVLAARHHADKANELNREIKKIGRVILFLMGDEENDFPVEEIEHPDIEVWVMSPLPERHKNYHKLATGYTPHARNLKDYEKTIDVFFSGQITHARRREMWDNLLEYEVKNGPQDITKTRGFTQGLAPEEYIQRLSRARVAPCPSGPEHVDSFRLFEAFECMSLALADERDPKGRIDGYWDWFFETEVPFYKVKEWDNLVGYTVDALENWQDKIALQTAWYLKYKRNFAKKITEQCKI